MNKTTGFLIAAIVVLVGAVMFLLGQQSSSEANAEPEPAESTAPAQDEKTKADEKAEEDEARRREAEAALAAEQERARAKRPVRIGRGGPNAEACRGMGSITNLPGTGGENNYLNVRTGPSVNAPAIDRLGDDHLVFICDQNEDGSWIGIVYPADGLLDPDVMCEAERPVSSVRPYDGPCQSGWVSARYVGPRYQG